VAALPSIVFRCPHCRQGALSDLASPCPECGERAPAVAGVPDFVRSADRAAEREFYDDEYAVATDGEQRSLADLGEFWDAPHNILGRLIRKHVGDLRGLRVLLLGNGKSDAELHFLADRPAALVLSDLSATAVHQVALRNTAVAAEGNTIFAAIDAYDLPFFDGSVDVVYGCAFVHHLSDVDTFLSEVARVLAPGGRAVFMDDAYAPLWQRSKETWLRPVMKYTHRRNPISPEDERFTMAGGFREDRLAEWIRAAGGIPFFERQSFLYYFWTRAADRLFPVSWQRVRDQRAVAATLIAADRGLERFELVRRNMIRLVWGFSLPPGDG
jgi:SAM-dependent methyltransferase